MPIRTDVFRLLVLSVLVNACFGEFTDSPLVETPPARRGPEALLSSLASLSTSGVPYGAAIWNPDATLLASPVSHAAGSNAEAAAQQRGEDQHQKAGQPLEPPHKALWPLATRDLATLLLTIITLFIAAGGGIGGGAVFIVCYVFVGGKCFGRAQAFSTVKKIKAAQPCKQLYCRCAAALRLSTLCTPLECFLALEASKC
jgi:hypothetical protein